MFHADVVEKIEAHILYYIFFFQIHAACEIMSKNIVELVRPPMTIWSIRIASWIPEATQTHSQYVIFIALPL